jgi:hypothetical protein
VGEPGGAYVREDWSDGGAPTRHGPAHLGILTGATVDLAGGYTGIELDALTYFRALAPHSIVQMPNEVTPGVVRTSTHSPCGSTSCCSENVGSFNM